MPVQYDFAHDVKELAIQVLEEDSKGDQWLQYIDPERIVFIRCSGRKFRRVASMSTVKAPYDLITKALYIMTVYDSKYDHLDAEKKKIVIQHELQHCDYEFAGKLKRHDIEDFENIIEKHGLHWIGEDDKKKEKDTDDE